MNKILIIGAGNVATALAADLSLNEKKICILKSSYNYSENFEKIKKEKKIIIENNGIRSTAIIDLVTTNFEEAFLEFKPEIIIVTVQTTFHEVLIRKISKYLNNNQVIMFIPGYLSTCFILEYVKDNMPIVVEAESSPIDCRVIEPGVVKVLFRNVRNPLGVFPKIKTNEIISYLQSLNLNFVIAHSVVEAAIHNPNLIVHTIGAIMSIPRIEYCKNSNYSMYKEVFTPSIYNLVDSLDNEKMAILEALNIKPMNYFDACCFRNSENLDKDSKYVFIDYAENKAPDGPFQSDSRYVTEDVPQGLVLLESLGKLLGINTPVSSSLITISEACLKTDFREKGRTVEKLGLNNLKRTLE